MLILSRKWYVHTCVHRYFQGKVPLHFLAVFCLYHKCVSQTQHLWTKSFQICFLSFSKRSLWSVIVNPAQSHFCGAQTSSLCSGSPDWISSGLPLWKLDDARPREDP